MKIIMIGFIIIVALVVLVVALVKGTNEKSEPSEVKTQIAKEEYRKKKDQANLIRLNAKYEALERIKMMLDDGVLTIEEYDLEKNLILCTEAPQFEQKESQEEASEKRDLKNLVSSLEGLGFSVIEKGDESWSVVSQTGETHLVQSKRDLERFYRFSMPQNN